MKWKMFVLVACFLFEWQATSQSFDWIKQIYGGFGASLTEMVSRSDGCLFAAGTSRVDCFYEHTPIYELRPGEEHTELDKIYFMGINQDGSLKWHKLVYGHNHMLQPQGRPSLRNMKIIGDTAVFADLCISFPSQARYRLMDSIFIIDTLLFSDDTGFLPPHFFDSVERNEYIGLPLWLSTEDGHVVEYHTVEYAFIDSNGNIITRLDFNGIELDSSRLFFKEPTWRECCIDDDGNFIGIAARHSYFYNEKVSSMCYFTDNKRVGEVPRLTQINGGNKLFVKFSPHFDSLLAYSYLFDYVPASYECTVKSMKLDSQGNICDGL